MIKDVIDMLKKVIFNMSIISILGSIIIYFINKRYMGLFFIGCIMAIFSFIINCFTTSNIFKKNINKVTIVISYALRVVLVCIVGIIIAKNKMDEVLPYILGYSMEFLAMIIYGVSLNKEI